MEKAVFACFLRPYFSLSFLGGGLGRFSLKVRLLFIKSLALIINKAYQPFKIQSYLIGLLCFISLF